MGTRQRFFWLKEQLELKYKIKHHLLMPPDAEGDETEGEVLNRIIRCNCDGWQLEGGPRHAELVVDQLGVIDNKTITTAGGPGDEPRPDDDDHDWERDAEELASVDGSCYTAVIARCNYLSFDRFDAQIAIKEACRGMSRPTTRPMQRPYRIGRILKARPRLTWYFPFQEQTDMVDTFVDANWAGCTRNRKGTSGGCIMVGSHCLTAYSKTQCAIVGSSAESELFSVVRGTCEGIGICTLICDLGGEVKARVHMDSSAAKGIVERRGASKVRHLDIQVFRLEAQQLRGILPLEKVKGIENPADILTKHTLGRCRATLAAHQHEVRIWAVDCSRWLACSWRSLTGMGLLAAKRASRDMVSRTSTMASCSLRPISVGHRPW